MTVPIMYLSIKRNFIDSTKNGWNSFVLISKLYSTKASFFEAFAFGWGLPATLYHKPML
jgi:hypothetical protein